MRVLVTGAYGFIGAHVVAALLEAGHEPVCAVRAARRAQRFPGVASLACDFARDTDPSHWLPRLRGIDAVVNCAGILRERGDDRHETVHVRTPAALFAACEQAGVRRVIQISALGDPADGAFIETKHRGDAALMRSALEWTILRPSVVYSARGSYGGTSLLRALAALPWIPLPGAGAQRLQPLAAEDLARAVVAALARRESVGCCLTLGGPESLSLREYLQQWRQWLALGPPRFAPIWLPLAHCGAWLGERAGAGPMGLTMWRMLARGNVVAAEQRARSEAVLGYAPRALHEVLARTPAHSADRWHARLYLLMPLLRAVLAATWIASGLVGLVLPEQTVVALGAQAGMAPAQALLVGSVGSTIDIALGVALALGWRPRWVLAGMALSVIGYSLGIGLLLPRFWLDPFGGLLKNAVVLVALAIAAATAERS